MYDQLPRSQVNEVFYFSLNKKMNRPCPDWGDRGVTLTCRFRHPNHVTRLFGFLFSEGTSCRLERGIVSRLTSDRSYSNQVFVTGFLYQSRYYSHLSDCFVLQIIDRIPFRVCVALARFYRSNVVSVHGFDRALKCRCFFFKHFNIYLNSFSTYSAVYVELIVVQSVFTYIHPDILNYYFHAFNITDENRKLCSFSEKSCDLARNQRFLVYLVVVRQS